MTGFLKKEMDRTLLFLLPALIVFDVYVLLIKPEGACMAEPLPPLIVGILAVCLVLFGLFGLKKFGFLGDTTTTPWLCGIAVGIIAAAFISGC